MTNHFDGPGYVPGHAEARAEADRRAQVMASKAPQLSPEAMAIKTALGVPAIDRTDEEQQARDDKRRVGWALDDAKKYGGNYGARSIDNVIAKIGIDRFLAAAPPDVAAKMRAQIKEDRKREQRKAERAALRNPPKPKPVAKIDGMKAWAIRSRGTQAEIDALNAYEAAEEAARDEAAGAKALARNIRNYSIDHNGTGKPATAGEDPQAVWSRAIAANNPTLNK